MNSLNVNNWDAFLALTTPDRKAVLAEELSKWTVSELAEHWNCKEGSLYDMRRHLGIPRENLKGFNYPETNSRVGRGKGKNKDKDTGTGKGKGKGKAADKGTEPLPFPQGQTRRQVAPEPEYGFSIHMYNHMKGDELIDQIIRISEVVNKQKNYKISIDIKQLADIIEKPSLDVVTGGASSGDNNQ